MKGNGTLTFINKNAALFIKKYKYVKVKYKPLFGVFTNEFLPAFLNRIFHNLNRRV